MLADEDVAEMARALGARDLDSPHAVRIVLGHLHRVLVALVEGRPAAPTLELGLRGVERVLARAALEVAFASLWVAGRARPASALREGLTIRRIRLCRRAQCPSDEA